MFPKKRISAQADKAYVAPASSWNKKFIKIKVNWQLYVLLFPTLVYFILFQYGPMYGLQIAFKDFSPMKGIWGSEWVGITHFESFLASPQFYDILKNTLLLSAYELILFPIPVILALLMNQLRYHRFKRFAQTVTYAPHFISVVVLIGMLYLFLGVRTGLVNIGLEAIGLEAINFLASPEWFKHLFVWSGVWQNAGWGTIIYLAALASVSPELHEAAVMDGASKFQRIIHIDLPSIMPTIVILLLLNMGNFMAVGFEKAYLMQNSLNVESSEIIQTFVYKRGILNTQYSYSAAVGLFNNVINFIILLSMNRLAKMMKQNSLW
ncbi:sugar ABC transporter permease [Bacillaceae bacterium SIJ1]|uniref:ABC transporter permease n=1 Tax=Litoribacterium kuwaitense TaxID=1398745 RepID=UPI0013EB8351|nr:ABC transporter permease subunit [Litoribacterium kuwaitense]NGP45436.1 sugar ABC transporter permease [Litoribacterium kuwaitense]